MVEPIPAVVPDSSLGVARAVLASKARSFSLASRLLPAEVRDDVARLYAYCRHIDDLADDLQDARALDQVRREITGAAPPGPIIAGLLDVAARRGLPLAAALALLDGVEGDLAPARLRDDRALLRYCWHVAGTVGLMMSPMLGCADPAARPFAVDLGVAMQLTNICRDVREDALNGRVYLPATRLLPHGVTPDRLLCAVTPADPSARADALLHAAVAAVTIDLLRAAERWYDSAAAGLRFLPLRGRLAAAAALCVYRGIGRKLLVSGGDPLQGRTVLTGFERLRLALSGVRLALSPPPPAPHDPMLHLPLSDLMVKLET